MNAAKIAHFFERWLMSRDPIAIRGVGLIMESQGSVENSTDLLAAGFSAGFIAGCRHAARAEVESQATDLLADYEGTRQ